MLHVPVPGGEELRLEHLVLDVNGTLTDRGRPLDGVVDALDRVREELALHVRSADTFGTAEELAATLHADFRRIDSGEDKRAYVERLGADRCVAIGNGRNDAAMLAAAGLGIAVVGPEGAHATAVSAADVVVRSIGEALALLCSPQALTATVRP